MIRRWLTDMRFEELPTPCYIVDEEKIVCNLRILREVAQRSGAKILLAQKAFAMHALYPLIGAYLDGTAASGLYEARLGKEYMGKENHVYSAAFRENEMDEIISLCDHIVLNSFAQLDKYRDKILAQNKKIGLRINPQHSTQQGSGIYDPCAEGSRLGITPSAFQADKLQGVSGVHFHTLCEQNADALEETLGAVEEKFGTYLYGMEWVNFGGGHHITRADYDRALLERYVTDFSQKYGVQVYLEPGEAIALNAGFLVTEVLDVVHNEMDIAILDTSAACHMPDVLEMPYRPPLVNAGLAGEKPYTYRLGSQTCLAGDIIGDYSFDKALRVGEKLVFEDMAIYSMVKNNMFNGMPLPAIVLKKAGGDYKIIKQFGYEEYKSRLS